MGWFDDQIKQRKLLDEEVFSDSFVQMAGAVIGSRVFAAMKDDRIRTKTSIDEILKFYHVKSREIPDNISDVNEQLEFLLRPYGIMRRNVELEKGWYKDAIGAMLAVRRSDQAVVAMIPVGFSGYYFIDPDSGKKILVNKKNQGDFEETAIAFYKPFPLRKINIADLLAYMAGLISVSDLVLYALSMAVVTLIGMLMPKITNLLYSDVIQLGNYQLLSAVGIFLLCVSISSLLFSAVRTLNQSRIDTKLNISVEAATMMRVLSLPANFFKKYSSGELATRVGNVRVLCELMVSSILSVGISSVFSLAYITQIFKYAPGLVIPSVIIIAVTTGFSVISTFAKLKLTKTRMELSAKENGMSYAIISGVQKVKLSGSEKRVFARWGNLYAKNAQLEYNPPLFLKINGVIATAISLVGTIVMYTQAYKTGVSYAEYAAFTAAYGMLSGAFSSLAGIAQSVAQIRPILDMAKPLLETVPEVSEGKQVLSRISGGIELNNVSFRYSDTMPNVIDDLSLKIKPGEYLAIVGKTGCGKSTLVRLLLGFEKPQNGAIYYDGRDIETIDLKSLRRKIGVVMQEGKLFQGDIYSNIIISAPWLTMDDAWAAAEMAGIADDIRQMPMGMHTIISEGSGGISGGQRQRLMIARAVAPKPKILIFDEATSALDNITQKKVSESLDALKCTRIVIAHRLSTIKHCDRIICLEGGKIIEEGTYEELIANKGFFAELVERQRITHDK